MSKKTPENILRELTLSQLDPLYVILNTEKAICSSEDVTSKLRFGTGKSLSGLNALTTGEFPILRKMGKLSARSGFIWGYNKDFMPVDQARKVVKEVLSQLEDAGIIG